MAKPKKNQIDWSTFLNNIKSAQNPSTISPGNGANNFSGVAITFTVETACVAMVSVSIGASSTTDYEFQPQLYVDGTAVAALTPSAAAGNTSNRATVRGFTAAINLTPGSHTLTPGAVFSSGTNIAVQANAALITAIVLGNVTA